VSIYTCCSRLDARALDLQFVLVCSLCLASESGRLILLHIFIVIASALFYLLLLRQAFDSLLEIEGTRYWLLLFIMSYIETTLLVCPDH